VIRGEEDPKRRYEGPVLPAAGNNMWGGNFRKYAFVIAFNKYELWLLRPVCAQRYTRNFYLINQTPRRNYATA